MLFEQMNPLFHWCLLMVTLKVIHASGAITPDALKWKLNTTWVLSVVDSNFQKDKTSIINDETAIVAKRRFELIHLRVCNNVDSHSSLLSNCHRKAVHVYSDLEYKNFPTFTKMEVHNGTFPCFHFTYVTKDTVCCSYNISFSRRTYTYETSHCLFEPFVSLTLHNANKLSLEFALKINGGKIKNISFNFPRKNLLSPYLSLLRMSQKLLHLSKQSHQQISVQRKIPYHSFLSMDTKYMYKKRKRRQAVSHAKSSDNVKSITENIQGANSLKPPEQIQSEEKQRGRTTSYFNSTVYQAFIKEEILRRQRDRDAQWAYLCLVFVMCVMLWFIWYLRGFHSRNSKKKLITMHDNSHLLTVKEVLWRKSRYLPMFHRTDGLEEVFVHDCGNDP